MAPTVRPDDRRKCLSLLRQHARAQYEPPHILKSWISGSVPSRSSWSSGGVPGVPGSALAGVLGLALAGVPEALGP